MYSDGLIERRGESLDQGLDRLEALTVRLVAIETDALASLLISELTSDVVVQDDIIVVCARWEPSRASRDSKPLGNPR